MSDEPSISQHAQGSYIAQAAHGGSATVNVIVPPPAVQEQNRVRFLKRLRYRYDKQWEQSLEGASMMTLGLVSKPDAVLHHTGLLFLSPQQPESPLPPGTSISQVYEQAGQELLILGEPGAGKSTLLLDLARRRVERAEQDAAQPLPVIIPLSTWAVKQQPLTDWLSEQLIQLYDVPRRLSHSWVQMDQLLLLLDGFDEVPQEARVACIKAIAAYRKEHLVPIVVCSRRTEFEEIPRQQRLVMQSAVVVQPLTRKQVGAYLLQGDEAFSALRTVLHINPVLQELVTTPLMLHILTLTYTGSKARDLPQGGSPKEQQRIIFASYIEHMIERRRNRISFPLQRIIPWLSWLARQMQQHNQTVFYLEQLQPNWLSGNRMLRVYGWLAVRGPGVLIGVLLSLSINLLFFTLPLPYVLIEMILLGGLLGGLLCGGSAAHQLTVSEGKASNVPWQRLLQRLGMGVLIGLSIGLSWGLALGPIVGLSLGLSTGLCSILFQILLGKSNIEESPSQMPPQVGGTTWQRLIRNPGVRNGLLVGLLIGLSNGLSLGLRWEPIVGLSFGLIFGLSFGLIGGILSVLRIGRSMAVQLTDRLVWSWRSLGRSLLSKRHVSATLQVTVLCGLLFGLLFGLRGFLDGLPTEWLSVGLSLVLCYWLLLGLFGGVSGEIIEDQRRVVPNRGIRDSAFNGLVSGLVSTIIFGLIGLLSDGLGFGLIGLIDGLSKGKGISIALALNIALCKMLSNALSIGVIAGLSAGLLVGLLNGGLACLRHYVLRFLLWRAGSIPWNLPQFLEYAAERILLHQVGGGYIFLHRLLLDYFADLEVGPVSDVPAASLQGATTVPASPSPVPSVPPVQDVLPDLSAPALSLAPPTALSEVPRLLPCGHERHSANARFCSVCGASVPS